MNTNDLREMYLDFFEGKGCERRSSDVLVPKEDKTVLFTPAGMNQFKNEFLGIGPLTFTKATTCQKCLRTGDIENVGVTAYHHTFFEMLGNFSFGDYFKKDAIHWAWEFLTEKKWLGLDPDRLTVTVYQDDDEAFGIWENGVGLDPSRIRRDDEHENFWPAGAPSLGPDGVCGPCSEIYFTGDDGNEVEIWNLVFTQFNRVGDPPDNLHPLPKKNIDTGMGLERTAAVLQGHTSNYEIDILKPLCIAAGEVTGQNYTFEGKTGRALRRIADHTRAVAFAIHENCTPGAKEANYIVRLLLRRALMEGYLLGMREPFLFRLVEPIIEQMGTPYPELKETREPVKNTIKAEEEHFLQTIERGLAKFEKLAQIAKEKHNGVIPGGPAFDLHQTDGFVKELVVSLADDRGLKLDEAGFEAEREKHEDVSRGGKVYDVMAAGPLEEIESKTGGTKFVGYEELETSATIVGLLKEKQKVDSVSEGEEGVTVILDTSPFYGESGGQVGDEGVIRSDQGEFSVIDTQKHVGLVVHVGNMTRGRLTVGDEVTATVTEPRRTAIQRAHSATHLLHHALQSVVGKDATQRGSKVMDDLLTFDFAHGSALTPDELDRIETIVNDRIAEGASVEFRSMPKKEAQELGAMMLFGEKYPDIVRVVSMGEFSRELCGGTHLSNTGQVGLLRIVSEKSVAAGVRRITAETGPRALQRMRANDAILAELQSALRVQDSSQLVPAVEALRKELQELKTAQAKQTQASLGDLAKQLLADADEVGGAKVIGHVLDGAGVKELNELSDHLTSHNQPAALLLGCSPGEGKANLLAVVSKDLTSKVKAGEIVKRSAAEIGGKGGGRPDRAQGGGTEPAKLPAAIDVGLAYVREALA